MNYTFPQCTFLQKKPTKVNTIIFCFKNKYTQWKKNYLIFLSAFQSKQVIDTKKIMLSAIKLLHSSDACKSTFTHSC